VKQGMAEQNLDMAGCLLDFVTVCGSFCSIILPVS